MADLGEANAGVVSFFYLSLIFVKEENMSEYPKTITYHQDGVTVLNEAGQNLPLRELSRRTDYNKKQIEEINLATQRVKIMNVPVADNVPDSRIVYFNGSKWDMLTSMVTLGELVTKIPTGLAMNITGITGSKMGDIYTLGLVTIDPSMVDDIAGAQIGVPYFLSPSQPGKITAEQPQASMHIGTFITGASFVLNIQMMTSSHIHRRALLDPLKWVDNSPDYLLYPIEELGQLPLPFRGVVVVMENKYMPKYGPYILDGDGLKLVDFSFFEDLLGILAGLLYVTVTAAEFDIEVFWSDPRTLTTPGLTRLTAGTENIVIDNQVPGQPNDVGSLVLKNIPTIRSATTLKSGSAVVKDVSVSLDGTIELHYGEVVEKITEGSNIAVDKEQGTVKISAGTGKFEEKEMSDAFMQGSLSKIYPNTILTYIEFPYSRDSATIYKFSFPDYFDNTGPVTVYAAYFGVGIGAAEVPIDVGHSVIGIGEFVSEAMSSKELILNIEDKGKSARVAIKEIDTKDFRDTSNILYFKLSRPKDEVYASGLGVISVTVKYKVK